MLVIVDAQVVVHSGDGNGSREGLGRMGALTEGGGGRGCGGLGPRGWRGWRGWVWVRIYDDAHDAEGATGGVAGGETGGARRTTRVAVPVACAVGNCMDSGEGGVGGGETSLAVRIACLKNAVSPARWIPRDFTSEP